jgi:squamous cell carcinoma antigen recognized by T-cells 3
MPEEKKGGDESNVAASKRGGHECGTPCHLSSACPNKRDTYSVSNNWEPAPATVPEENNVVDESEML